MSRKLIVRHEAEIDLAHAAEWYEDRKAGLGTDLLTEVRKTLALIVEKPESFPFDFQYVRRALVGRFPYVVHFVVRADFISVIAVLHGSQDKTEHLADRLT